jgi:hypothetical protein
MTRFSRHGLTVILFFLLPDKVPSVAIAVRKRIDPGLTLDTVGLDQLSQIHHECRWEVLPIAIR